MRPKDKPRARFCWLCGKKLVHSAHVERVVDGHSRILHVGCSVHLIRNPGATTGPYEDEEELESV